MLIDETKRILQNMFKDKRAMAPAPKAPAGGAGKGAGTGKPGGGAGMGGGMPGMPGGSPADMLKTESGELIRQHDDKIKELKEKLVQIDEQIKQVKSQIEQNRSMQQDTSGPEQQLAQLKEAKSGINDAISAEQDAISKLKEDRWKELKLKAVGFVPEVGTPVEMAGEQAMAMKHGLQEKKTAAKVGKIETKAGKAESKANIAGATAAAPAARPSGPGGFATEKVTGGEGAGGKASVGAMVLIVICALAGGLVFKAGGVSALPAMAPFVMGIIGLIVFIKTGPERGWAWIPIVLLFAGAIYISAVGGTGAYARMAYDKFAVAEERAEMAEETVSAGEKGISGIIKSAITSYERQMAIATGQHMEGKVDQAVKEDVGIEILQPYLPNPTMINENEIGILEIGSSVTGFDPKTPIVAAVVCNLQSREEAQSISRTLRQGGKGPNLNPGELQTIRPEKAFEGYSFNKDVTCYPRPETCGNYIVTISAQADNLLTTAQMQNYIIDKAVFDYELEEYALKHQTKLRSFSDVDKAIDNLYGTFLGDYISESQKSAIKVMMVTKPVRLMGVDQETDIALWLGIENMMGGWIMDITKVEVTIDEYFSPLGGFCEQWKMEGDKLVLKEEYLKTADFTKVAKNQQKKFPSCHLGLSGSYDELLEPTEASFHAFVEYNYIVQEEFPIEIRNATGGVCKKKATT